MGKKTTPKPTEEIKTVVVEEEPKVEKPRKKRSKKTVVVDDVNTEIIAPPVVEEPETVIVDEVIVEEPVVVEPVITEETVEEESSTPAEKKKRRLVTKETFVQSADELQKELTPFLEENKKIAKLFKIFLNDAYRLMRIKTHTKKQKDATNSGFMRPVKPSPTLEKFLTHVGEDISKPLTRAHLTTVICKYIKENDLQNPKDRRIIFPDEEFKKLFQITENDTEPLTYYNIQKRIQSHVSKIEETVA